MQLKITINMDNEAFENDNTREVTRILRAYCNKIDKGGELLNGDTETLMDANGNSAGNAKVVL